MPDKRTRAHSANFAHNRGATELEYYKEQLEHGRHIEVQRSTVAGLGIAISGAIVGELLKKPLAREQLPYTVTFAL